LGKPVDVHGFLLRRSSSVNIEKDFRPELRTFELSLRFLPQPFILLLQGAVFIQQIEDNGDTRLRYAENLVVMSKPNRHGLRWRFTAERQSPLTARATQ
jgi:hypothetical protein